MSDGCEGCSISGRGQNEALTITRARAKKFAIDNEKTVAIYKEGFEFYYCEYDVARQNGYQIIEVVSKHC